jgi:hypothetical protein
MKHTLDAFDPLARMVPRKWIDQCSDGVQRMDSAEPHKWLTTLRAPLAAVRASALEALAEMNAAVAYRYETEEKIVIRCTLPERQIRAELKPFEGGATRIVVVTMRGSEVDRITSGRIVDAIEQKLQDAGYPAGA